MTQPIRGLAGANTTDPTAPFYVDLTGLDPATDPPTRDPAHPSYPSATELSGGQLPAAGAMGCFVVGPFAAREALTGDEVPKGRRLSFVMASDDSVVYRVGIARDEESWNASVDAAQTLPGDPSRLDVTTSRPASWRRTVTVYVPHGHAPGDVSPLLVVGDGEVMDVGHAPLCTVLDRLIAEGRVPPLVAVLIGSGGQDAQGSQRGREYDTVSGAYAHWVESEVLPRVEREAGVTLTKDPEQRAAMGISSSGAAAFTMAWFRPDLFRRVLAYSPTFVNQQWPTDPALPGGAWQYHSDWAGPRRPLLNVEGFAGVTGSDGAAVPPLVLASAPKPIRFWFAVGDRDMFYPVPMADGMHDWVLANQRMAAALTARGYDFQFLLVRDAGHVDETMKARTLPAALEWVWGG